MVSNHSGESPDRFLVPKRVEDRPRYTPTRNAAPVAFAAQVEACEADEAWIADRYGYADASAWNQVGRCTYLPVDVCVESA